MFASGIACFWAGREGSFAFFLIKNNEVSVPCGEIPALEPVFFSRFVMDDRKPSVTAGLPNLTQGRGTWIVFRKR